MGIPHRRSPAVRIPAVDIACDGVRDELISVGLTRLRMLPKFFIKVEVVLGIRCACAGE
jgi:hypothetical protein